MRLLSNRIIVLAVILCAFALRVYAPADLRYSYDYGYPYGLGVGIRESIAEGRFSDLPVLSYGASIFVPNPVGLSYLWAVISAIDPSPFSVAILTALLNVLVSAMTYDLVHRLWGATPAFFATVLAASSPWSAYFAWGGWQPAILELFATATAWLLVAGILSNRPRRVLAAFACAAVAMQTYLVAFGIVAQAAATSLAAILSRSRARLRRSVAAGLLLAVISLLAYLIAGLATGQISASWLDRVQAGWTLPPEDSQPAATGINREAVDHALRIASGRAFVNVYANPAAPGFETLSALSHWRANWVEIALIAGVVIALVRSVRHPGERLLLIWFATPIAVATALSTLIPAWRVHPYYMLLTSPAGYALAAAPFIVLDRLSAAAARHIRLGPTLANTMTAGIAIALAVPALAVPAAGAVARADAVVRAPSWGTLGTMSLRSLMRVGEVWRRECAEIDAEENPVWTASVAHSLKAARPDAIRVTGNGQVWVTRPEGGNCATQTAAAPDWPNADVWTAPLGGQQTAFVYRARPYAPPDLPEMPLAVNHGWTLLELSTTPAVKPGGAVTVAHTWRIDALPGEPFGSWYYAPFVQAADATGKTVATVDGGPSILGRNWRTGDIIHSQVWLTLPADAAPGSYTLTMTLFDPNQKKNAVYFAPGKPNDPIVALVRPLEVR